MKPWFCMIGGQQYGPVAEDVLRQWIVEGRLRPTDIVWREGMAQWAAAGTVPELFLVGGAGLSAPSMPGGTGGLTPNRDLMRQAREALRGNWGIAIGFLVIFSLVSIAIQLPAFALQIGGTAARSRELSLVGRLVGQAINLVLTGPLELGFVIFYLALSRRQPHDLGMVFRGFQSFGKALAAHIVRAVFVIGIALGAALPGAVIGVAAGLIAQSLPAGLIVGGILAGIPFLIAAMIMQLGYAMTFYLLADKPGIGPVEAIFQSWRMMRGHKWKLFCLGLRFIGWAILAYLSCCIGFLWLVPYVVVSFARFYHDLQAPAAAAMPIAPVAPEAPAQPTATMAPTM